VRRPGLGAVPASRCPPRRGPQSGPSRCSVPLGGRAVSSYQLALQQLTDSALPTGAFAHSLGFEAYVDAGVVADEASFGVWLSAFVSQSLTYSDGLAIRLFYEGGELGELDSLLSASLLPRQVREASLKMGSRLLEIGGEVFPSPALGLYRDLVATGRASGHQPLAFAVVARSLGVPLQEALPLRHRHVPHAERRPRHPPRPERRAAGAAESARRRRCRPRRDRGPHAGRPRRRQPRTGNFTNAARTPTCPDVHELTVLTASQEEHHD